MVGHIAINTTCVYLSLLGIVKKRHILKRKTSTFLNIQYFSDIRNHIDNITYTYYFIVEEMRVHIKFQSKLFKEKKIILKNILEQCRWRCGMSMIKTGYGEVAESFKTIIIFWA